MCVWNWIYTNGSFAKQHANGVFPKADWTTRVIFQQHTFCDSHSAMFDFKSPFERYI